MTSQRQYYKKTKWKLFVTAPPKNSKQIYFRIFSVSYKLPSYCFFKAQICLNYLQSGFPTLYLKHTHTHIDCSWQKGSKVALSQFQSKEKRKTLEKTLPLNKTYKCFHCVSFIPPPPCANTHILTLKQMVSFVVLFTKNGLISSF